VFAKNLQKIRIRRRLCTRRYRDSCIIVRFRILEGLAGLQVVMY